MNPPAQKTSDRAYYLFALRIVGDFGATIAIPAIMAALIGTWLDEKYGHAPLSLVICLVVAFAATARIIQKKAKRYGDEYGKMN